MRRMIWGALLATALVALIPNLAVGETKGTPPGSDVRDAVEAQLLIDGRVVARLTDVSDLEIAVEQVATVCPKEGKDGDCDSTTWQKATLQAAWQIDAAASDLEQNAWLATRARHEIAMNAIRNIRAIVRQVDSTLTDPTTSLKTKHDTVKNSISNVRLVVDILGGTAGNEPGVEKKSLDRLLDATRSLERLDAGYELRWRPGRPVYGNITLTGQSGRMSELLDWYKRVLDGKVERKSGSIIYLDRTGGEVMRVNITESMPSRLSMTPTTTRITLVVERIERK